MKIHWLAFIVIFCSCITVQANTQLTVEIKNQQGQPLAGAVLALVAQGDKNFTQQNAIIDQKHNEFVPDLLVVRTNTMIRFPNSDDVRHHVYSFSPAKKFELRLYHGKTAEPILFDKPGKVVLGCNIHDSMKAHIYVLDTDYYQVSNNTGKVEFSNIPTGNYQLQIFHPQMEQEFLQEAISINPELQTKRYQLSLQANATDTDDEFEGLF
jgi:plastocyanin